MSHDLLGQLGFILAVGCVIIGTSTRTIRVPFMLTFGTFLAVFALAVGNPIGLLVSPGGWMILGIGLSIAILVGLAIAYIVNRTGRATVERSRR